MSEATCWALIRGAAEGKEEARTEFTRRYLPVVRAYLNARWEGVLRGEIDDAVQEVFLECLRRGGILERARPDRGAGFRAFLLGSVRNVARRFEERRLARRDGPGSESFHPDDEAADEESLTRLFDRAWAESLLREATALLSLRAGNGEAERRRRFELLHLRFGLDLPIHEIARRWGEEPRALQREYARALREFQGALEEVVAGHHGGSSGIAAAPGAIRRECRELLELVR